MTLQGSKLMLGNHILQTTSLIPGDHVSMNSDSTFQLLKREEHIAIGIVDDCNTQTATLSLATLPPACPFKCVVPNNGYSVGDRIVLWLNSDGSFDVQASYPSPPSSDAECIATAYRLTHVRETIPEVYGPHHYTKSDCVDLTHLNTFTIDPVASEDFDDAISVDVQNSTLYIHIVDIAKAWNQLSGGSRDNLQRLCLSLYLANERTEHLLTYEEATCAHSLVEGSNRNAITVQAKLVDGIVESYEIYPSIICVKQRWSYEQVAEVMAEGTASPEFMMLADLHVFRSKNVEYSCQLPSLRMLIKQNGWPQDMILEDTNDVAHGIVSTAMILANLIVSKHLHSRGVKIPNRFHDVLRGIVRQNMPIDTGNPAVDSFILVKRFAKAYYSIDQSGHFGLGLTDYVHFTSPIRRYADVIVHKLLAGWQVDDNLLEDEVAYINKRSQACRVLQDLYKQWKRCHWISTHSTLGPAYITDVKKVGVMWFMPSLSLNGFTHISNISPKQYWSWNETDQCLKGSATGQAIRLGCKCAAKFMSFSHNGATVNLSLTLLN